MFRYDDFSNYSSSTLETVILELFKKHALPVTIGVIPFSVPDTKPGGASRNHPLALIPERARFLQEGIRAGAFEVALHGYLHHRIDEANYPATSGTEFAGQAYATQLQQIEAGKNQLEVLLTQEITTFIPPWNTYDFNTLQVLERLSFGVISGGGTGAAAPSSRLKFLPVTSNLYNLRESVQAARRLGFSHTVICCSVHQGDLVEIDKKDGKMSIPEFEGLLRWLSLQGDLRVTTLCQAAKTLENLSAERFRWYSSLGWLQSISTPFILQKQYPLSVYPSAEDLRRIWVINLVIIILLNISMLVMSFSLAYAVGRYLYPQQAVWPNAALGFFMTLPLFAAGYSLKYTPALSFRWAMGIDLFLGSFSGLGLVVRRYRMTNGSLREKTFPKP